MPAQEGAKEWLERKLRCDEVSTWQVSFRKGATSGRCDAEDLRSGQVRSGKVRTRKCERGGTSRKVRRGRCEQEVANEKASGGSGIKVGAYRNVPIEQVAYRGSGVQRKWRTEEVTYRGSGVQRKWRTEEVAYRGRGVQRKVGTRSCHEEVPYRKVRMTRCEQEGASTEVANRDAASVESANRQIPKGKVRPS